MPDAQKSSKSAMINLGLLAAAASIFVVCMVLGRAAAAGNEEAFVGTDSTAVSSIEDAHPHYKPWFHQLFTPPSAEVESGLFALQAALGAGVFGYAIGAMRRRRTAPAIRSDASAPRS